MSFAPVLVMNGILLTVAVLLAVADRLLVTYGECRIRVRHEDEERDFKVKGGGYLHSSLMENGIDISSSCGGKATCGYCKIKVLSGGGEILPTEEIFMSRKEKREGMRLACQVKIRNDLEIEIPDFLTTVRGMVENGTFDSKMRWRVKIDGRTPEAVNKRKLMLSISKDDRTTLDMMIEEHRDPGGSIVKLRWRCIFLYYRSGLFTPLLQKISNLEYDLEVIFHAFKNTY